MKIKYKEPYWVKFNWDLSTHHENQYVTEFNKNDNYTFYDFQHNSSYIITCEYKIDETCRADEYAMVYGKPGKNMGLTYNYKTGVSSFEFWTKGDGDDKFHFIHLNEISRNDLRNGVIVSIVRRNKKMIVYKNFEEIAQYKFQGELIDDYKNTGLFIGCSNPGTPVPEHRYHGELYLDYFTIMDGISDIKLSHDLYVSETYNILNKKYYKNILCLYDFKTVNNLGIIYDESKYCNFLEKVPTYLIAE